MKEELQKALAIRQPTLKPYQIEKCVDKYVAEVMREIAEQLSMGNVEGGEIDFAGDSVRRRCNRISIEGKKHYVLTVMHEHPSTSLVHIVYEGNSHTGRVSKAVFNPPFKKEVLDTLKKDELAVALRPAYLDQLEAKANWDVRVDPTSLDSYIKATRVTLQESGHSEAYAETLTTNLLIAKRLADRIHVLPDSDIAYVSEYWETTDSGRMYGHGLSLQRLPRHVRDAALGVCHKYDFKASSYALMTSLAVQIDPTLKVEAIKHYVKHRASIRKRIAADVGISEEWMKEIFTAIGFGARINDNPHSYLRDKLGKDKYNLLMMNRAFADIIVPFKAVSETIAKAFPKDGFEFFGLEYSSINPATGAKRNVNQKLAWIYQRMESVALHKFMELVGVDPLLTAHDCLFLKVRLSPEKHADVMYQLNQMFSLLTFEHEEVQPIRFKDPGFAQAKAEHRRRIAEETRFARAWTPTTTFATLSSPHAPPTPVIETKRQYEARRNTPLDLEIVLAMRGNIGADQGQYFKECYWNAGCA